MIYNSLISCAISTYNLSFEIALFIDSNYQTFSSGNAFLKSRLTLFSPFLWQFGDMAISTFAPVTVQILVLSFLLVTFQL